MSENWGDKLARSVSSRIAGSVASEAALSSVPARDKDNGRLFLARSENSLWRWNSTSSAFERVSLGGGGSIPIAVYDFREVDASGDVANASGNGGLLASDTGPSLEGDSNGAQRILWATGNVDKIACSLVLPPSFSGAALATLDLWVVSGTTDAATFTVVTSWDGGSGVTDTADDASTKSATLHKITATIAAADIPNTARLVTIILTPGTHGTNTTALYGASLNYSHASV